MLGALHVQEIPAPSLPSSPSAVDPPLRLLPPALDHESALPREEPLIRTASFRSPAARRPTQCPDVRARGRRRCQAAVSLGSPRARVHLPPCLAHGRDNSFSSFLPRRTSSRAPVSVLKESQLTPEPRPQDLRFSHSKDRRRARARRRVDADLLDHILQFPGPAAVALKTDFATAAGRRFESGTWAALRQAYGRRVACCARFELQAVGSSSVICALSGRTSLTHKHHILVSHAKETRCSDR